MQCVNDACLLPMLTPIKSRGAMIARSEMSYIGDVLLFRSSRMRNKGADAIGRYDIYVNTVLLIWFEGINDILTRVGCFRFAIVTVLI